MPPARAPLILRFSARARGSESETISYSWFGAKKRGVEAVIDPGPGQTPVNRI